MTEAEKSTKKGGEGVNGGGTPELKDYIKAGYPCMFLQTVEPEVAEQRIRDALKKNDLGLNNMDFGSWRCTTGLMVEQHGRDRSSRPVANEIYEALQYIENRAREDLKNLGSNRNPMAVVFHNVRPYLDQIIVIQALIDCAMVAKLRGSHIFLVGAYIELPPELRSLVTFVDCPLPTQGQLAEAFSTLIEAYKDKIASLPKARDALDGLIKEAATAAVGLDSVGAENALALSLSSTDNIDISVIQAQKEQEVRKSDVLEFVNTDETMDNVGGFDIFKEWLTRRSRAFTPEAREYKLPYPKGVLIVGPAGTGKSLVAKAASRYLKLPCLRFDIGKVYRSLVGQSEAAVRLAIQVAEAVSPVVLWMDKQNLSIENSVNSWDTQTGNAVGNHERSPLRGNVQRLSRKGVESKWTRSAELFFYPLEKQMI